MGDGGEDDVEDRFRLGRALKTVARDVLLKVYHDRFAGNNPPGATPFDMMRRTKGGRAALSANKAMKLIIQANTEKKFDVTALYHLLKNTCKLKGREAVWSDNTKLEGNIEIVYQLRNEDAHWTQPGCSKGGLTEDWVKLTSALTNILRLSGNRGPIINETQEKLRMIREGERGATPGSIEDEIRKKLVSMYRRSKKTTLRPLVWAGERFKFHHSALDTFTSIRITTVDKANKMQEIEVDVHDVLEGEGSGGRRVVLLQGETGTGKTSLLRYYAASWANDGVSSIPALDCLQYVLFLDLTSAAKDNYTAHQVIQELLGRVALNWSSEDIFKELARARAGVLFMIDAFDERYDAYQDAFKDLLKKCPEASFLVVTRPHRTQFILRICEDPVRVLTAHGFGRQEAVEYATKLLKIHDKEEDVREFIKTVSPYQELLTNPQLLCWSCWFWLEKGKQYFTTRGKVFTSITDFLLRKLCYISSKRLMSGELPSEGQKWQSHVAQLAFTQATREQTSLPQTSPEIKNLERLARELKIKGHLALSTLMQCDSSMTSTGERLVFQFVHESHFCYLAARHVLSIILPNTKPPLSYLLRQVEPVRRQRILLFLVSLLYEDPGNVPERIVSGVINVAKQYATFYDVRYFLDLVEESGHNPNLSAKLGECIPEKPGKFASQPQPDTIGKKLKLSGRLWLRPKELQREESLLLLLKLSLPARVWLRLCDGPHNDTQSPVSGHKAVEGSLESALSMLSKVYHRRILLELIVSDCTISVCPTWPDRLWWLSLQRCNIDRPIPIPKGLLMLKLHNCNLDKLDMKGCDQMKALDIRRCKMTYAPQLPPCLEKLKLELCNQTDKLNLPSTLEELVVLDYKLPTLPTGLRKLIIRFPGLETLNIDRFTHYFLCDSLVTEVREAVETMSSLECLSITNLVLCNSDLQKLQSELQQKCLMCSVHVKSHSAVFDGWSYITASMNSFLIPNVA